MEEPEFEVFYRSMSPRLTRYAQRRIDPGQAEDLAGVALHVIWRKDLPAPADDADRRALESLAYRVLEGLLRNQRRMDAAYRNALGRAEDLLEHRQYVADVADEVLADGWPEWVKPLELTDREVLALLVDGYSVKEIAIILDCSRGAVSMRLKRAKERIRLIWPMGGREVEHDQ